MEILKKCTTLIHYSFDQYYFGKHSNVISSQTTASTWRSTKEDGYILTYDTYYSAKENSADKYFIKYHSNLELHCVFEDKEKDAVEIVEIKDQENVLTGQFLEKNTMSFYHLLDFHPLPDHDKSHSDYAINRQFVIDREVTDIKRVMGVLTLAEMSEEEREIVERGSNTNQGNKQ